MGCQVSSSLQGYSVYPVGSEDCRCQCHKNDPTLAGLGDTKDDPRIPLTQRQKFLVKRSWKAVGRNISQTGVNMFLSLFEKNAEVIKFFKRFESTTTISDLRASKILESHVRGVMFTIDEAITTLDDADSVIHMLQKVGRGHIRLEGFDPNVFLLLEDPFLLAVRDTLGDRYTVHIEDIYKTAICFILTTLVDGFKEQLADNDIKSADLSLTPSSVAVAKGQVTFCP